MTKSSIIYPKVSLCVLTTPQQMIPVKQTPPSLMYVSWDLISPLPLNFLTPSIWFWKAEVNGGKQDASNWNSPYRSFALQMFRRAQWREKERAQPEHAEVSHVGYLTLVSLLHFFCVCFFLFFSPPPPLHGYLSHPLRLRQGGVLSEPKCPSVCSGRYSLGIKPKPQASTPWNNSLCHSSEICHYNLLNFKTDWQRDKKLGPLMQRVYSG